jgi:hypothetical protein
MFTYSLVLGMLLWSAALEASEASDASDQLEKPMHAQAWQGGMLHKTRAGQSSAETGTGLGHNHEHALQLCHSHRQHVVLRSDMTLGSRLAGGMRLGKAQLTFVKSSNAKGVVGR